MRRAGNGDARCHAVGIPFGTRRIRRRTVIGPQDGRCRLCTTANDYRQGRAVLGLCAQWSPYGLEQSPGTGQCRCCSVFTGPQRRFLGEIDHMGSVCGLLTHLTLIVEGRLLQRRRCLHAGRRVEESARPAVRTSRTHPDRESPVTRLTDVELAAGEATTSKILRP